jgi:hypothetical protein
MSEAERREDLYLWALRYYVEALGGGSRCALCSGTRRSSSSRDRQALPFGEHCLAGTGRLA